MFTELEYHIGGSSRGADVIVLALQRSVNRTATNDSRYFSQWIVAYIQLVAGRTAYTLYTQAFHASVPSCCLLA